MDNQYMLSILRDYIREDKSIEALVSQNIDMSNLFRDLEHNHCTEMGVLFLIIKVIKDNEFLKEDKEYLFKVLKNNALGKPVKKE